MKDLLKKITLDVIVPWALTALASFAASKLAPKADPAKR